MTNYPQSVSIHKLFSKGHALTVGKGEVIIGNGTSPDGVYYIESGYVKIYTISDAGDEYVHIIYGPGEIFPLIWGYLSVEQESLFYESIAKTTLWRVSRETFNEHLKKDNDFCYDMSVQLAHQFRVYSDRIDNLEYKKADERIAYRLLFLASRFGIKTDDGIMIDAPLTHETFANSINLVRESVSRQIESFERQGILKKNGQRIVIKDVQGLASKLSRPVNPDNWSLV